MKKIKLLLLLFIAVLIQTTSAQTWNLPGNALVGGERLGSTNAQPLNIITNNTTRLFIKPDGKVGINTQIPDYLLTIKNNGTNPVPGWVTAGAPFLVAFAENTVGDGDMLINMASDIGGARPTIFTRRSRGTLATPATVINNDFLGSLLASGYDGTGFQNPALINFIVDGTPSTGNVPARISLITGSNGANRAERLKVGSTGNFTFNNTQLFLQQSTGALSMGSVSPHASSIVDINSTTKGVLFPRMTAAQKNAIASPATGLIVYQTDDSSGVYYYSAGWNRIGSAPASSANSTLSNLEAPTAVNVDLLPGSSGAYDLGSSSVSWKDIYFSGDVFLQANRFLSRRGTNNFFGDLAGNSSVTGSYNTATGQSALTINVTGNWNTANGHGALAATNNSYSNTGVGFQALIANTTGSYNTATGVLALGSNTSGVSNSATGVAALNNLTSGSYNSAIGYFAGANLPGGNYNTYLGSYADGPSGVALSNATAIGYNAAVTASNSIRVGNTSVTSIGGQVNWTAFSDGRFKRNIKENVPGLEFINNLRAVTYTLDVAGIDETLRPALAEEKKTDHAIGNKRELTTEEMRSRQRKAKIKYTGFVAQEVEEAAKKINFEFSGVDAPENSKDFYGLRYGDFVVPLVKAVQELSAENKELKARLDKLEALLVSGNSGDQTTSASLTNISLHQNDPNPFRSATRISYNIPAGFKSAQIMITDVSGKALKTISIQKEGNGFLNLDGSMLSSGTYNYSIVVDGKLTTTKQMMVIK